MKTLLLLVIPFITTAAIAADCTNSIISQLKQQGITLSARTRSGITPNSDGKTWYSFDVNRDGILRYDVLVDSKCRVLQATPVTDNDQTDPCP